ncbi:MAG: NAD(+)/NADH kinase [Candidatus Cloacimonetes bacterium]|nr:NAD(+)/NADH kinase [Candidatus Cloacimonadota bacterium]MBL7085564.1 NAD(+)/NADH kinase [Candidatus Cloacimonadota bacterium]
MKNIGIFYNPLNHKDKDFLNEKISLLKRDNLNVFLLTNQQSHDLQNVQYIDKFSDNIIDMLIVFGGDGTMLLAAKLVIEENIPMLGFNLGKLGFLSECMKDEFSAVISNIIQHNFTIEQRLVLSCYLKSQHQKNYYAINDCVIYKGAHPKLIDIDIYKDELLVYNIRADGVIVATPTGSTAYSLSAGGSIIFPECEVVTITPINPHNLFLKPIIFPANSKLNIILRSDVKNVYFNIDGENINKIKVNDRICVGKAEFYTKFVHLPDKYFCKILREKFYLDKKS